LTIAVPRDSPIHSVGELLGELRASPQRHVFAITDGSWAADNLAALVQDAGIEGYVPYRIFPSTEEATLALAAGSADVVLAPHGTILPELRARTLRALRWPATAGGAPSSWIELFAVRGTSPAQVARLRRQLLALTRDPAWRALLRRGGQAPAAALSSLRLRSFLPAQMQRAAGLQQLALHAARHSYEAGGEA
ncbi:MAG TPA: hypothetical protein VNU24_01850, partial [Solirubrobacteraceae bacterium]|nr:hypothetical protein [Solirubrobacteraceae bacterium]